MDRADLIRRISGACYEKGGKKRLDCAKAFELVEKHGVDAAKIGAVCNEEGIKIMKCQLGCF